MSNPFQNRAPAISGPARDIAPVTPSDTVDLSQVAIALYVEAQGTVTFTSVNDQVRSVAVAAYSVLPVGVKRVHATGTTATGIHAMVLA